MIAAMIALAALALDVSAPTASPRSSPPDRPPSTMTSREIAAFNRSLTKDDPNYITCRREEVTGSLAKKLRVCRTKADWERFARIGEENARETLEAMSRAPLRTN